MSRGPTYFDSSAIAKLVLPDEDGSDLATAIFNRDGSVCTNSLSYPEVHSALARRNRHHALGASSTLSTSLSWFEQVWDSFIALPPEETHFIDAARLVLSYPLSGADAVHLATALDMLQHGEMTFVTWDRRQAEAAAELGFTVQPPIDRQTVA